MRVPARVYATEKILDAMEEGAVNQGKNIATLPGIQKYSIMLPDVHFGYGFPIGGVAAFDLEDGIISPGGVGYDINCGVRLITTNITVDEIKPKMRELIDALFKNIPSGVGSEGRLKVSKEELDGVAVLGCYEQDCHYRSGAKRAKNRTDNLRKLIESAGIDGRRLYFGSASASEGERFAEQVTEFIRKITAIGPLGIEIPKGEAVLASDSTKNPDGGGT